MRARGLARTRVSAAKVCLRHFPLLFQEPFQLLRGCVPCTNAFSLGNVHETNLQAPRPPSAVLANTTCPAVCDRSRWRRPTRKILHSGSAEARRRCRGGFIPNFHHTHQRCSSLINLRLQIPSGSRPSLNSTGAARWVSRHARVYRMDIFASMNRGLTFTARVASTAAAD